MPKTNKNKYPLRKVTQGGVEGEINGHPSKNLVLLECGHLAYPSAEIYGYTCPVRQRCRQCFLEAQPMQNITN